MDEAGMAPMGPSESQLDTPWFVRNKTYQEHIAEWIYKDASVLCSESGGTEKNLWEGAYNLNVARANYGSFLFWDVHFSKEFVSADLNHPLGDAFESKQTKLVDYNSRSVGDVVADNELTRTLLKWLSLCRT
jgi:hypothetical protein